MKNGIIQILNQDLSLYGCVAGYETLEFTRALNTKGAFKIEINVNNKTAKYMQADKIVYIDENTIGYIEKITVDKQRNSAGEKRIAEGYELKDMLMRCIYPSDGNMPDSYSAEHTETIVKSLIQKNISSQQVISGAGTAAAARQTPNNAVVAADMQRGTQIDYSAWLKDLPTEIYKLLSADKLGLQCTIDRQSTPNKTVYDIVQGNDLTATIGQAGGILLSVEEKQTSSALQITDTTDKRASKTLAIVAGEGGTSTREILEVYTTQTEPSGFARRETYTEARDAASSVELSERGRQKLATSMPERGIKIKFNSLGAYTIDDDFTLGDFISVQTGENSLHDGQVCKIAMIHEKGKAAEYDVVLDYDVDDQIISAVSAKHMNYDALSAAGTKEKELLRVELSADASNITFDNLQIESDGGVYEIHVKGKGTANSLYSMLFNNVPAGNAYYTAYDINNNGVIAAYLVNTSYAGMMGTTFGYNVHHISFCDSMAVCMTEAIRHNSSNVSRANFGEYLTTALTDIKKIELVPVSGNFAAETVAILYRK